MDGDSDRNTILGQNAFFVTPYDSLVVLANNLEHLPWFKANGQEGQGRHGEVLCPPAGSWTGSQRRGGSRVWRKILVIGSDRVREQVWAALAWLQILAVRGLSVQQLMEGTLGRVRQKFLYQIQL